MDISDLYLFHLIVLLNPVYNCFTDLLSSQIDKVTTNTYNYVSVILDVLSVGLLIPATAGSASGPASFVACLVITDFLDHVKIKNTSQLINGMSNIIQILLKWFNATATSTFFPTLLFSKFPVTLIL